MSREMEFNLGRVKVDKDFGKALIEDSKGNLVILELIEAVKIARWIVENAYKGEYDK